MNVYRLLRRLPPFVAVFAAVLSPCHAQNTALDFGFGLWWTDSLSSVYSISLLRSLVGPFDYGIGVTHLEGPEEAEDRRLTGGEISLGMFRDGSGPYLVAAAGLGMRHSSGNFDAQWSAGAGYELRALNALSLGLEGRYRVEDRASRGFWRLNPSDARGVVVQARLTFRLGGSRTASTAARPGREPTAEPTRVPIPTPEADTPREIAALRSAVVETAMEAMGAPYRWGGTAESGFDCSGLIQYAYGEHGLILPRTSRDQARMGQQVPVAVSSLQPGDILGFAEGGSGVTHVGLYVGDGMFIHSSSSGVKLSSLIDPEGDGRWWQERWVTARRLIN